MEAMSSLMARGLPPIVTASAECAAATRPLQNPSIRMARLRWGLQDLR